MARDYPAFLFYPEDFTTGTAEMSPLEVGIYIRCLCHQWHKLSVPDDPVKVGRITGATSDEIASAWPAVKAKFKLGSDGQLKNQRLEKIRADLKKSARVRSVSGKAGAEARWGNGKGHGKHDADVMANASQSDSKNMASRVGNVNVNATAFVSGSAIASGFLEFWKVVPNKTGKASAEKAYEKAIRFLLTRPVEAGPGADSPHSFLQARMAAFAASPIGTGDPQFVPYPSTWLNQGRYDDDPKTWIRRRDPRGVSDAAQQFLLNEEKHGN